MNMFTRRAAMALAVGTAMLSSTGAQAQQEVDISGFTQGCFGAGCSVMPADEYDIPGTASPASDLFFFGSAFNGRTANGRLAVNTGNGTFGQFVLGTNPTTVNVSVPFRLLISFTNPTLQPAGTEYPTFMAMITGNISTTNDGGISIEYNPSQGPWVDFMTASGQTGQLRVSMRNLDVPSGGAGFQNGLIEAQLNQNVVPEPASMILLGSGLIGLAGVARRRRRKAQDEA